MWKCPAWKARGPLRAVLAPVSSLQEAWWSRLSEQCLGVLGTHLRGQWAQLLLVGQEEGPSGVVGEESAGNREVGTGQQLQERQASPEPVSSCLS